MRCRPEVDDVSGQLDQVGQVLAPGVLGAVGQEDDLVGVERPHGALVVGDQHDRAGVRAQRREQVLEALRTYAGAIVLVTHDEGAVRALNPDKVILLPDGTEDAWSEDLADLVELA